MNKKIYKPLIIIPFIVFCIFSCEEDWSVDCNDCYTQKPDSADLIINLTINEENPFVPLIFYKGEVENNVIEWIDTAYEETLYLYSPVDQYYSIKAFYKSGSQTLIAVDGDKLKIREITDACDYDCWVIRGGRLDVRLLDNIP